MQMSAMYSDQLRQTMEQCGLPVSPVVQRDQKPYLRYDAIEITDTAVIFLWLGKPVYMVRRSEGHLAHMTGEMALELH